MRLLVSPIKCQGIKTKLVPTILENIGWDGNGTWIEPFVGSGVVALNVAPKRAILADTNPHLIDFFLAIKVGEIDGRVVRLFLEREGAKLSEAGQDYYYLVRDRFNAHGDPLDFLFLNRSCFNGLIRFNKRGGFNVPFGHKPKRFSPAYITKIVNQVDRFRAATKLFDWVFICQDYQVTIRAASEGDFLYCDPPYVGRHVDYYHDWDEEREVALWEELNRTDARFMLSTWHSNQYRENKFVKSLWSQFSLRTREHFYHVGAKESNRNPMLEALVTNYSLPSPPNLEEMRQEQLKLLERIHTYHASSREGVKGAEA